MGKKIKDEKQGNEEIEKKDSEVVEKESQEATDSKELEKEKKIEKSESEMEKKVSEDSEVVEDEKKTEENERETEEKVSEDSEVIEDENEENIVEKKKFRNIIELLQKPVETVKNAVKNNSWKSGLAFLLVYLFVVGLVSSFQFAEIKFASYDVTINYAKDRLESAEENYRTHPTTYYKAQVEVYKETLSEARREKWENFADLDFYVDLAKSFGMAVLASSIRFALLVVILFVVGKMLNGQSKFSQIVAGVGWSANVYYISLIILPLLAQIPYLSSLEGLTGIVGSLFFLLIYFVFQSAFDLEEDKAVIWTFVSMLITVFLVNLILYSETWTSGVTNNLLK